LAIIGGELKLVHSGGTSAVNIVDVMTGVQTTVLRISSGSYGSGKAVGYVGYGNFLGAYSDGQAVSVHRYFPNSVRSRFEIFYSARPYRYPFVYWKENFIAGPVYSLSWWEEVLALDEDTSGDPVEIRNSLPNTDTREPNPQSAEGVFYGNWGNEGFALRKIIAGNATVIDNEIQLGGAVYPRGLYINRAGEWYFRYADGSEVLVPEVLAPMKQKYYVLPYWTDGIKVYRILG